MSLWRLGYIDGLSTAKSLVSPTCRMQGAKRKPSRWQSPNTWSVKPGCVAVVILDPGLRLVVEQPVEDERAEAPPRSSEKSLVA